MTVDAGSKKGKTTKMRCGHCGHEMNFHAEKVNQSARADSESDSAEFGGVVEEIHTCPACGAIATRRAN